MDRVLLKYFWSCGDNQIIEFALLRARLNKNERDVICYTLDECMSQEQIAEKMGYTPRRIQQIWKDGANKLISIPWVKAYAQELVKEKP